jgi:hypothetical protein
LNRLKEASGVDTMSDPVSIALTVPGLAVIIINLLKKLKKIVAKYRNAHKLLEEKGITLEDHIQKLQLELAEFHGMSPDLPKDLYAHIGKMFVILKGKLAGIEVELDSLLEADRLLGINFAFSSIDKMVEEVAYWQRRVEDFFELLARFPKPFKDPRIPNPATALGRVQLVSQAISSATESTPVELDLNGSQVPGSIEALPNSTAYITRSKDMIVEIKKVDRSTTEARITVMKKDVIDLARVMSADNLSSRGILRCRGYRYDEIPLGNETRKQFQLVFNIPSNLRNPRCLREVLIDKDFKGQIKHPLNERLSLAKQLARAVLHVHSKGHVHKNIRPETILLFEVAEANADEGSHQAGNAKAFPASLGIAFLTGFERVRKEEADTVPIEDTTWAEDIYRHPSRQGPSHSEDKFVMLHDVYSLGVCLLEIATWRSFVDIEMVSGKTVKTNNVKACNLMQPGHSGLAPRMLSPLEIQRKLIRDAKNRIPIVLGDRFSQAVLRCLRCVETFASDAERDPLLLGVK